MLRSLIGLLLLASLSSPSFDAVDNAASASYFDENNLLELSPIPTLKEGALQPDIDAKSALIMDYNTGLILYGKNINEEMPMASLTKIMTAILILEHHSLSEVVTVPSSYSSLEGVRIWLSKGEQLTVGDLLKALLIRSAGDAAMALAEFHSGTVEDFVKEMNERAKELNLIHTHYVNPIGLDAKGHYSSAADLATITKYALHFPAFREIVKQDSATITSVDGRTSHSFESTNYLLNSYLDIEGVKTGTTDEAGESLINLARGAQGQQVIAVLLNSPGRFQENKSMIDWALRSYLW
jgi:serine-type D-Ala-D-Ala carboxypeptidase (penicillin-binding protein 5/6)